MRRASCTRSAPPTAAGAVDPRSDSRRGWHRAGQRQRANSAPRLQGDVHGLAERALGCRLGRLHVKQPLLKAMAHGCAALDSQRWNRARLPSEFDNAMTWSTPTPSPENPLFQGREPPRRFYRRGGRGVAPPGGRSCDRSAVGAEGGHGGPQAPATGHGFRRRRWRVAPATPF